MCGSLNIHDDISLYFNGSKCRIAREFNDSRGDFLVSAGGGEHVRGSNRRVPARAGQDERGDDRVEEEVLYPEEAFAKIERIEAEICWRASASGDEAIIFCETILRRWLQNGGSNPQELHHRGQRCL